MNRRLAGAALVVAAAAIGCVQPVSPARTFEDYENKARDTAETVRSSVQVTRLAADAAGEDRVIPPYLSVLVSDAESDAGGAQSTFDGVQPPDGRSDRLREQFDEILTQAVGAVADTRVAARRADFDEVAAQAKPLAKASRMLRHFISEHE